MKEPDASIGQVKLYQGGDRNGVWPSDIAEYYDRLDEERGIPKAKLIIGYKQARGDKRQADE